jgi:type VI secretion system protein ImpM
VTQHLAIDAAPAWFGKIACLGDFASRRLPQDTAQVFDTWLARGVETSRAQLGERWLNVYLTSPLWRFAFAPGVIDTRWWFGVMMPSVDNVGRYFPLLVTQPCSEAPQDTDGLNQLERWYSGMARAALGTLQPGGSVEQFESELAQAPRLPISEPAAPWAAAQWPERSRHELGAGVTLAQCLNELAVVESLRRFRGCSLWWSLRPGSGPSSLSTAVGLPGGDSFIHMLEGTW